jgi:hypothetical protein
MTTVGNFPYTKNTRLGNEEKVTDSETPLARKLRHTPLFMFNFNIIDNIMSTTTAMTPSEVALKAECCLTYKSSQWLHFRGQQNSRG